MKLPVLTAGDGAAWEPELVRAFDEGRYGVKVARRCVDVVDLLSLAAAGHGRAVLASGYLRHLDAECICRLHASDVALVCVVRRDDLDAEERLRAIGVGHVVSEDAEPHSVASVLSEAVEAQSSARSRPLDFADPGSIVDREIGRPIEDEPRSAPDVRRGKVVAVWGPTGAPGRSTVAINLADEIARLGVATLLIDADTYGGSVAALLGLLDESPGVAAACRIAASSRLDPAELAALSWQVAPSLRVLTGVAFAQRWPEVRPSALSSVLTAARQLATWIVVDCGFSIEADEELTFDTLAPRRNGATLTVLSNADVVLAVGGCDPIGLQRVVRALTELTEAGLSSAVDVVMNKARTGLVPGDPALEVTAALRRFAGVEPIAVLPFDLEAADAALAAGRLLAEIRPRSTLRTGLAALARSITGIESRTQRRRRQ